jgi:hypothetical protein
MVDVERPGQRRKGELAVDLGQRHQSEAVGHGLGLGLRTQWRQRSVDGAPDLFRCQVDEGVAVFLEQAAGLDALVDRAGVKRRRVGGAAIDVGQRRRQPRRHRPQLFTHMFERDDGERIQRRLLRRRRRAGGRGRLAG